MSRAPLFPDGFLWGAATSAYQIEGSPLADGAGPSIWYRFTHTPGRTLGGPVGDVACDHYRRYAEDVDLMHALGLGAYRFSLSWSRLMPDGTGRVNQAGIDFYSRLIDRLLARGIQPMVTLYHWDLPAALDDRGGWLNPEIAEWFARYAEVAFRAFADLVSMWATINEPWVVAHDGYVTGANAPGHRNLFEAPRATHHLLRAHGAAVRIYRGGWNGRIGLVVNLEPKQAASKRRPDIEAAARADAYFNRQYLDPVLLGRYPDELRDLFGEAWPEIPASDMKDIHEPLDFLGINYYTRKVVRNDPAIWPDRAGAVRQSRSEHMTTGWEVHPAGLTSALCWVRERYGNIPLYITENGAAFPDPPRAVRGRVHDPRRVSYLRSHLLAARDAMDRGVDLRGYFVWSLLDNVEWSSGYTQRLGIVHVDFETQKRTPKSSAAYYTSVIESGGAVLGDALDAASRRRLSASGSAKPAARARRPRRSR